MAGKVDYTPTNIEVTGDDMMDDTAAIKNYRLDDVAPVPAGVSFDKMASKRAFMTHLRILFSIAEKAGITLTERDFKDLSWEFAWGIGGATTEPQPMIS